MFFSTYLMVYIFGIVPFWLVLGFYLDSLRPWEATGIKVSASFLIAIIWPVVIIAMIIARFFRFLMN